VRSGDALQAWRYGGMEIWSRAVGVAMWWRYGALEAGCGRRDVELWSFEVALYD